ncbi:ligase-associated DNA damage response exonuclease [Candidatus Protochlamydia sp. R18]|uniref:ligase-associated DNA damage response exonuclease n=1 Tax=Candidatus Protochlamydia sp. R18 TaxID=1353977 RepID=UPI0005A71971|nr:ligase-associated DNA damage response exonuclease [Candidatus Protochlamydia sp. R18]
MEIPLKVIKQGLYCPDGDFFIDAWQPVSRCIITHAHGDHAYAGHGHYIATDETIKILRKRIGGEFKSEALTYNQKIKLGNTWVSLHPAGHILGSAQVRIETPGCVTVISGDYKRAKDETCLPFEVVECDIFVTESTFALPIYQWPHSHTIAKQIKEWWFENAAHDCPSILFCYSLGKAQRVLSMLADQENFVYLHGAICSLSKIYAEMGIKMARFKPVSEGEKGMKFSKELILAPPSAAGTPWLKRFPSYRTALASGWMQVRGTRRRHALDRGFILSDHADWKALIETISQTQAKIVLTTHGNASTLAQYLRETQNLDARELKGLDVTLVSEDQ